MDLNGSPVDAEHSGQKWDALTKAVHQPKGGGDPTGLAAETVDYDHYVGRPFAQPDLQGVAGAELVNYSRDWSLNETSQAKARAGLPVAGGVHLYLGGCSMDGQHGGLEWHALTKALQQPEGGGNPTGLATEAVDHDH
jgi:hypothetical protein